MKVYGVEVSIVKQVGHVSTRDTWAGKASGKREARKFAQAHFHDLFPGSHVSVVTTREMGR